MSRQTEYSGKFESKRRSGAAARRVSGWVAALLILLLVGARFGTEAIRVLGYYDLFLGGRGMLRNREVSSVNLNKSLSSKDGTRTIPILNEQPASEPEDDYILSLDDGTTVVYNGHTYQLNPDLATVLVMGIDKSLSRTDVVAGRAGQCDVVLLVGLDTKTGAATVLNISREAYAEIEIYSAGGNYIGIRSEQLELAYAYGDGKTVSCENAVRAVSRLLYGLPIGSYIAVDMGGILEANEAVGGVTLQSQTTFISPEDGREIREGDTITLHGKDAERYLRIRSWNLTGNEGRMDRQKQYLTEFSKLVVRESKKDLSFPVSLFSSLSAHTVTDLSVPDVTFLSRCFLENGANFTFRSIDGTYGSLKGSAVYYLDEVDLFEAVLQVFYLRVD